MKILYINPRIPYNLLIILFLISCSSEDNDPTQVSPKKVESITLSSDQSNTNLIIGSTTYFTVKGNDGKDYTPSSEIMLNGNDISGRSYVFRSRGEFTFYAKLDNLKSNEITFNISQKELTSIELIAETEYENLSVNDKINFSILGNDGADYTLSGTILMNGEELDESEYIFKQGGVYTFTSTAAGLTSNEITVTVESSNYIQLNTKKILRNQEIEFFAYGENETDITSSSNFYVNGNPITGNSFKTPSPGTYEVYAVTNNDVQTSVKKFEVFIPKRSILFEDFTGTWCGWCPRITEVIKTLHERSSFIEVAAYHIGDDFMHRDENKPLARSLEIELFPHARYNRTNIMEFPQREEQKINAVLENAGDNTNTALAIETSVKNDQLSVLVRIISEQSLNSDQKLTVLLLQNGIIGSQVNYLDTDNTSIWYNMGNPIKDFIHDDVVEENLTDILGENISDTQALEEYITVFDAIYLPEYGYDYEGNVFNSSQFEIIAFLTDGNGEVINAQKTKVGKNANYE